MRFLIFLIATIGVSNVLAAGDKWQTFYDRGFEFKWPHAFAQWPSKHTRSKLTPEGLHIVDDSTEWGSGRIYYLSWSADPGQGGEVEARLKSISCTSPTGVSLLVSDGVHEEWIEFFPDRVAFLRSRLSAAFDCAGDFHTYRVIFKGTDISVYADDKLLIDGQGKFTTPAHEGRNALGFGVGGSPSTGEAIWQFVRFRGPIVKEREIKIPEIPGLEVQVGETQVIVPGGAGWTAHIFKFADGDIVVGGKRSNDGGKTWRSATSFHAGAHQFPNGEIIQLAFHTKRTDRDGVYHVPLSRSTDNGQTVEAETAIMNIPEATTLVSDGGDLVQGPLNCNIVGLRDGSVLASMYGRFKTDTAVSEAFPRFEFYVFRTFVVRSTDRGKTWDYLATVAYDPSVGSEGFCEPYLLVLPSGEILCFMRTGGRGGKNNTPMHLGRSTDDGKTWSKPVPIADRGVAPKACLMKNGIIACTYGRADNWLAFSLDQGKTWTGHFCFYKGQSSCYNCVEEVAPDVLLVTYTRWGVKVNADGDVSSDLAGTYFTVKRK